MRGATILLVSAAVAAPPASAASTPAVDFELGFTSQQPDSLTGASLRAVYKNPRDPNAKPSPLRTLTVYAPPGTRFDGGALPACAASDIELRLLGRSACPAPTKVGDATLIAMTGLGAPLDPVATEGTVFNTGRGVVEVFAFKGTPVAAGWDRVAFTAPDVLEAHPPRTPGAPPELESSVREIRVIYAAIRGPAGKPFITTPPTCPADGRWSSRIHFTTKDGGSYDATATTPCTPTAVRKAGKPPAGLRVRVTPQRIAVGRRVRVRVRVRSAAAACQHRATVRLAGQSTRTNAAGDADLRIRIVRPGRYRVRVSKPGCGRATTRLVVH